MALLVCRRLAIPWLAVPLVLVWEPMLGSIWGANVQLLLFAAFVAAFWRAPVRHDLHPEPRDLERPGAVTPRIGWYAATVASVKATQIHAWLAVAVRSPRAALAGAAPWVVVVAVTLPLVGIGLYADWLAQVGRASDPAWPAMGPSLLKYLPSAVFAAITIASLVIAVRLRGADTGAWLGLLMLVVTPNMHDFTGLFLLPAMLRIRLEFALLAAMLTSTATAEGLVAGDRHRRRGHARRPPLARRLRAPARRARPRVIAGPRIPFGTTAPVPRRVWYVLIAAAWLGTLIGFDTLRVHLQTDPLADVHAYYDAGARLNAGQPLYEQPAGTDDPSFYRYPPLLADPVPTAGAAPLRHRGAHLGGRADRRPGHDRRPDGAARPLDVARAGMARGADRLEPRGRPGAGGGHLPAGGRGAVGGGAGGQPQGAPRAGRDLLGRAPATGARSRASGWRWRRSASSRSSSSLRPPSPTCRSRRSTRSATSATCRPTSSRRCSGSRWSSPSAIVAWRRAPGLAGWLLAVSLSVVASPRLLMYMLSTLAAGKAGPGPWPGVRPPPADSP